MVIQFEQAEVKSGVEVERTSSLDIAGHRVALRYRPGSLANKCLAD
jgi:hypothetical protein